MSGPSDTGSGRFADAIEVLEREIRDRQHPQDDYLRFARRVLLTERGDDDAPPVRADGGVQQAADAEYEDALCPGCGVILTGSREPGDRGFCQEADRHVRFVEAMDLGELVDGDLETEEPLGETPADDVACADCGDYELLVGPLTFDGEVSEGADFVCRRCARKRALSTGGDRA